MSGVLVFWAFFEFLVFELFVNCVVNAVPGHVFQIFGPVEARVLARVQRRRHPKTVEKEKRLPTLRFIKLIRIQITGDYSTYSIHRQLVTEVGIWEADPIPIPK